ncbi:hypothetical protein SADUNF_Sadunf14G0139300 [Salix dunnii]|uniref:Uncharacterized protein n=1 Tax=Salix dunnii TaxID=1413687 RepID=A0A835JJS0_9ROSI|nr:hypothetical protein SADUNF_Sadunf14G0139300 [Salix dunnii]
MDAMGLGFDSYSDLGQSLLGLDRSRDGDWSLEVRRLLRGSEPSNLMIDSDCGGSVLVFLSLISRFSVFGGWMDEEGEDLCRGRRHGFIHVFTMYFTRLSPFCVLLPPLFLPSIYLFTGRDNNHIALQTMKLMRHHQEPAILHHINSLAKGIFSIDIVFAIYHYGFHQLAGNASNYFILKIYDMLLSTATDGFSKLTAVSVKHPVCEALVGEESWSLVCDSDNRGSDSLTRVSLSFMKSARPIAGDSCSISTVVLVEVFNLFDYIRHSGSNELVSFYQRGRHDYSLGEKGKNVKNWQTLLFGRIFRARSNSSIREERPGLALGKMVIFIKIAWTFGVTRFWMDDLKSQSWLMMIGLKQRTVGHNWVFNGRGTAGKDGGGYIMMEPCEELLNFSNDENDYTVLKDNIFKDRV